MKMKPLLTLFAFFTFALGVSQNLVEMTPKGFQPIKVATASKPIEQLIELSKSWANANKYGADASDVTANSLTITGFKPLAAYYYNVGVKYNYDLRYEIKVVFQPDQTATLTFDAKEFYANEVLTKTQVADFYTPEGKLKDDYRDVKPSLETTVDRLLRSYSSIISSN